jgi:hypothetical protein
MAQLDDKSKRETKSKSKTAEAGKGKAKAKASATPAAKQAGAATARKKVPAKGAAAAKKATAKPGAAPKAPAKKRTLRRARSVTREERWRMISESAYLRAEQRHFAPGGEAEDWFQAEAEVDALLRSQGVTLTD